jgi:sugar phosphate isomerase/epimerase
MIKSAATICLVPQARHGPFIFHNGLADGCARAAKFGFNAVEIFPPSGAAIDRAEVEDLMAKNRLAVAALGTGAGRLVRSLTLTSPDDATRSEARRFVAEIIELGAQFGAPAIIGWMQGQLPDGLDREVALSWLREALDDLGDLASSYGVPLLLEPLNRYETNLFNRIEQTVGFIQSLNSKNVRVLADLFHMNIEEVDIGQALRDAGDLIGLVDFADSNRQAVGFGHLDVAQVISALRQIGYTGYLSAEIFPLPTADAAAQQTIAAIRRLTS